MTKLIAIHLFLALVIFPSLSNANHIITASYSKQKPVFMENKGQVKDYNGKSWSDIKYIYAAPGFKLILKKNSFSYELFTSEKKKSVEISEASGRRLKNADANQKNSDKVSISRIDVVMVGANPCPTFETGGKTEWFYNYYTAYLPKSGINNVHGYTSVTYHNIYKFIDLVFYALADNRLKYNIIIRPGGNLENVKMLYKGMEHLALSEGKLNFRTHEGILTEEIPASYIQGTNSPQDIRYSIEKSKVSFRGKYDQTRTVVVDPVLAWATYFGEEKTVCNSIATDTFGAAYYAGSIDESDYNLVTSGAYETSFTNSVTSAFLTKFNKNCQRVWGTYYGCLDYLNAVSIDKQGNVCVAGYTNSDSLIATTGAFSTKRGLTGLDYNAFLVKFDNRGMRLWGTYYTSSNIGFGTSVAFDKSGNIFLGGTTFISGKFTDTAMVTNGSFQTSVKIPAIGGVHVTFLAKFNSSGKRQWGTFYSEYNEHALIGGTSYGVCAVATDSDGSVYLTGNTDQDSGVATLGVYQTTPGSSNTLDAFLAKFNSNGSRLWGTYFGGPQDDQVTASAIDNSGNIYLAGITESTSGIATSGAFYSTLVGESTNNLNSFLVKFNSKGLRLWSTYYGGIVDQITSGQTRANAVSIDGSGNAYLAGTTECLSGIATSGAFQPKFGGESYEYSGDAFIVKFNGIGMRQWGSYFGGSGDETSNATTTDRFGNVYLAGQTSSSTGIIQYKYPNSLYSFQYSFYSSESGYFAKFNDPWLPDAGIVNDSTKINFCSDSILKIYARVKNYSVNFSLDSVTIAWSIDGIRQKNVRWNGNLNPGDTSNEILLGYYAIKSSSSIIKIWTLRPNDKIDQDNFNDSLTRTYIPRPSPNASFMITKLTPINYIFVPQDTLQIKYFWQFGDGFTSLKLKPSHTYKIVNDSIHVYLTVTASNGCSSATNQIISTKSGIDQHFVLNQDLKFYPNPFINSFTIEKNNIGTCLINIYDQTGALVYSTTSDRSLINIDLSRFAEGLYMVQVSNGNKWVTEKIIKGK